MGRMIDGISFKELRCKNDDCRALLGYEHVKSGMVAFDCRNCGKVSVFRIKYSKMEENVDMLEERITATKKGGEINYG